MWRVSMDGHWAIYLTRIAEDVLRIRVSILGPVPIVLPLPSKSPLCIKLGRISHFVTLGGVLVTAFQNP